MSVLEIGTKGPREGEVVRGDNPSAVSPRELCPAVTSPAATVRQRLRLPPGPFVQPISAREIDQSELGGASAHEPLPGGADDPELEKHWSSPFITMLRVFCCSLINNVMTIDPHCIFVDTCTSSLETHRLRHKRRQTQRTNSKGRPDT
ncbi:hypothetical protein M514_08882 [Trichuris suis]|uniref:Uncharacterized protein n=1 Tax=Trichuris suis TaxID=68888 RepID=A0A085NBU2_9BILA|nr:hypothetical protein M513_08882 [Trichuris suis]KFD66938.1 hypothetical protein M514_08882 [Trichuris suis]